MRANEFNHLMARGKGLAHLELSAKSSSKRASVIVPFAAQCLLSSVVGQWKSIEKGYQVLRKSFSTIHSNADEDFPFQYRMFGQDFVSDLLGLLDITAPLCEFMVLSQSVNFLHWKNILWGNRMLFYMEAIINNLEEVPRYKKQIENIKNCNFQEVQLFLLNQDKMVHPDHDEEAQYTWMERTFNQSLEELKVFAVDLKVSAKNRLENGTAEISRPLAKCFDFEEMLVALAGRSCSEKAMQCVADKAHYLAMGREQFQIWFKYVISLPHVQEKKDNFEFLDESCSDVVFHHFKKCLCEMAMYTVESVYSKLGLEFMLSLDIAIATGGTEAIAESFYAHSVKTRGPGISKTKTIVVRPCSTSSQVAQQTSPPFRHEPSSSGATVDCPQQPSVDGDSASVTGRRPTGVYQKR
eukprot:gene8611-9538_t